jgi:hypothetical protein
MSKLGKKAKSSSGMDQQFSGIALGRFEWEISSCAWKYTNESNIMDRVL